ncbi:MAG: PD-(D/E)XK nuclease family protein [Planctomycetota bacterium]|jgi:hypothetical protein
MSDSAEHHPLATWLLDHVPERELGRTLVVTPSAAAAAVLRRAATDVRGALVGVNFVTPQGLADQILLLGGRPFRWPALDPLEAREILRSCLVEDAVGRYAQRFPQALLRLLAAVQELDRHGPVDTDTDAELTTWGQAVMQVAARFREQVRDRDTRGNMMAAARTAVSGGVTVPDRVLVAGWLRGEHGIDRDLQLLVAALAERGVPVEVAPVGERRPADVQLHGCPGFYEELRVAGQLCMEAASRGVAWHDMVVAAPTLTPYRPHLQRAFTAEGVPFRTDLKSPLLRHPRAALYLHVARLLFHDAPRESWLALVTSPLLERSKFIPAGHQAAFDRYSREEYLNGHGEHVLELARSLDAKLKKETALPALLTAVEETAAAQSKQEQAPIAQYVRVLRAFAKQWLRPSREDEVAVAERWNDCLEAIVHAATGEVSGERFVQELEGLLQTRGAELSGQTHGGVNVVSFENALAYPAHYLHLLGLAEGMVPGRGPAETFLSDQDRQALGLVDAEAWRQLEERRVNQLLHHAGEVVLSYSRRNALGMPAAHTMWLDRIGEAVGPVEQVSDASHPLTKARSRVDGGCCPRDLALDLLVLSRGRQALAQMHPALLRDVSQREAMLVLSWAKELDDFGGQYLRRDGDVSPERGAELAEDPVSVSALEGMGCCPQKYLFERAMGIKALPEELEVTTMPRNRLGLVIHSCLEQVYREFKADINSGEGGDELRKRMLARAQEVLHQELSSQGGPLLRELPALHRLIEECWRNGMNRMVKDDLGRLQREHGTIDAVELGVEERLTFPAPGGGEQLSLPVRGRLDRVDRLKDGSYRLIDFKTGRNPEAVVQSRDILKGTRLQLPVYALLLEAAEEKKASQVEVRAVTPFATSDQAGTKLRYALSKDVLTGKYTEGVLETLAVLVDLRTRGAFIANKGQHCSYCRFQLACRRHHPPSVERTHNSGLAQVRRFLKLREKSTFRPLLTPEAEEEREEQP